jgi:hypothetical protein
VAREEVCGNHVDNKRIAGFSGSVQILIITRLKNQDMKK